MGLCTYFINGNCRFGSKCVNDHIDLKTLLKNEADAVINGKQWLLSCFGPFKESVVIPNFIPDQSFEEIRIAFMENSKNGNVQNFVSNLMGEYNNALRKMNELKTPSSDTLQLIASIYNTSNSSDQKAKPPQSQTAVNPFQTSNIFGGNTQQPTMPSSNIFGTSTTQNNPFQQASTQQQTNSIFGSSTNPVQTSTFNQALQDQQKASIFGQSSSVFGSTPSQNPGSVFSNNQSNIFGQQSNAFSLPATQTGSSIFGSSAVQQPTQLVFGSTAIQQPAESIFGGITNTQLPTQSVFGSTPIQQTSQPGFAASLIPNVTATVVQQPVQNIFGGNTVQTQPSSNVFQGFNMDQNPSQNIFTAQATNSQNVFGGFSQNQGQNPTFTQQSSVFGTTQQSQPQSQSENMSGNIFSTQVPQTGQTSQVFGGNPFQQNVTFNDEHFYSKDEVLSPEQIQAFQAESFIPGKIPLLPPSKTLAYS